MDMFKITLSAKYGVKCFSLLILFPYISYVVQLTVFIAPFPTNAIVPIMRFSSVVYWPKSLPDLRDDSTFLPLAAASSIQDKLPMAIFR